MGGLTATVQSLSAQSESRAPAAAGGRQSPQLVSIQRKSVHSHHSVVGNTPATISGSMPGMLPTRSAGAVIHQISTGSVRQRAVTSGGPVRVQVVDSGRPRV